MLAGELALAGTDVAIVERRTSQVLAGSRARTACTHAPSRFSISAEIADRVPFCGARCIRSTWPS